MGRLKVSTEDYQDNLNFIKESGSTEKQSKPKRLRVASSDLRTPVGADRYSARNVPLSSGKNFGDSQYDNVLKLPETYYDLPYGEQSEAVFRDTLEEERAQSQPTSHKVFNGLGRFIGGTAAYLGEGAGYILALPLAAIAGDKDVILDNFVSQAFADMNESIKESLEVYKRAEVEERGFWGQIWSPEFLATDVADGLATFASFALTGGAIGATSKFLKIGAVLAKGANRMGVAKNATALSKAIDLNMIALGSSYTESFMEAKGLHDELKEYWGQRDNGNGTYTVETLDLNGNPITKTYTAEEVEAARREAINYTLLANMIITFPSAKFATNALFGTGSKSNIFTELGIKGKTFKEIGDNLSKAAGKKATWSTIGKEAGKGFFTEGGQEISQFAIEGYESARGKFETDDDRITGLIKGLGEALTTVEGQKAGFLGGMLGLIPGGISAYKTRKKQLEQAGKLSEILQKNLNNFTKDAKEYFVKDEEGNIKMKDGMPIFDINKFNDAVQGQAKELGYAELLAMAKMQKDGGATARAIGADHLINEAMTAMQVEGGIEMFMESLNETYDAADVDYKLFGFTSKEAYKEHLNNVLQEAKKAYDKVSNNGASFFGLNMSDLYSNKQEKKEVIEARESFYRTLEYTAAKIGARNEVFSKEVKKTNQEIADIYAEARAKLAEEQGIPVEEITNSQVEKSLSTGDKNIIDKKKKLVKEYKDLINKNKKDYELLFDKKEQQKAFEDLIKKKKEEKEEQEKYEEKLQENLEFAEKFYENLRKKGYGDQDGNLQDAFDKNRVRLQNEDGDVFAIIKEPRKEGEEKSRYSIAPVNELGHAILAKKKPLTKEELDKNKLNNDDAILTREEYNEIQKQRKIIYDNNRKLELLTKLAENYQNETLKTTEELSKRKQEMESLEQYLEELRNDTELNANEVFQEIQRLQKELDNIKREIAVAEERNSYINDALQILQNMELEIISLTKEGKSFTLSEKIKEYNKQIEDGLNEDTKEILEGILEINQEKINVLKKIETALENSIDALFQSIMDNKVLEDILNNEKEITQELADYINDYIVRTGGEGSILDLDGRARIGVAQAILSDPANRADLLEILYAERAEMWRSYNIEVDKILKVQEEIKILQDEYNRGKNSLTSFEAMNKLNKLRADLNFLWNITTGRVEGNVLPVAQAQREEQTDEQLEAESKNPKKNNPKTTVVNIYSDSNFETLHPKGSPQYKQAKRWAEFMSEISLDNLENYSVQFVSNKELQEMGITPPVQDETALYAVVLDGGEIAMGKDNQPVFTGIAEPDTYFGQNVRFGKDRIDISGNPILIKAEKTFNTNKPISEEFPFTYGDKTFTSIEEVESHIYEEMKDDYIKWRQDILSRTKNGETIYSPIKDVSRGMPIKNDKKNKASESLPNTRQLIIGRGSHKKANGQVIELAPGMIYAELNNGQPVRLLNRRIDSLPSSEQNKKLQEIINFMALAKHLEGDYQKEFQLEGVKGRKIPLFGKSNKTGIMDYLIGWNSKNKNWNIKLKTEPITGIKKFVFNVKGVESSIAVEDLFDNNGNVRNINDAKVAPLINFLKTKYLNVVSNNIGLSKNGKKKPTFLPTGWKIDDAGNIVIENKFIKDYEKFVMDNYLYTDIVPQNESSELPQFVNQYITFSDDISGTPPIPKKKATKESVEKEIKPSEENKKSKEFFNEVNKKTNDNESSAASFWETLSPPDSAYINEGEVTANTLESLAQAMGSKPVESKPSQPIQKTQEPKKKTECPTGKVPGTGKKPRNKKI